MLKQKCSRRSGWENCRHDQKSTSETLKCEGDVDSFFWKGIVHYEFVPRGETVNKEFYEYLNVLKCLREAVRRKRPEASTKNTWMLHHGNAPAHESLLNREFLPKHEKTVVPQPPYSSDLVPADFSCSRS